MFRRRAVDLKGHFRNHRKRSMKRYDAEAPLSVAMKKILVNGMVLKLMTICNQDDRADLPDTPGVYLFYNRDAVLLYVGRATSLRSRVNSYFQNTKRERRPVDDIVPDITRIGYFETPTVLEAILKEAALIREHQPPYNVLLKDDKSFLWIALTADEYPRVVLVRGHELDAIGSERAIQKMYPRRWGPFLSAQLVRRALDIVRRIFPWSDCAPDARRPCFHAQIGQCAGVCTRAITPAAYKKILRRMTLFLDGKRAMLERTLRREMTSHARAHRFEDAARSRNKLFALQHIQDIALIGAHDERATLPAFGRIEGYDISHLSGTGMVASCVVFEQGEPKKSDYRRFAIRGFTKSHDTGALAETITRRLGHTEWPLPQIFLIDGGEAQVSAVTRVLRAARVRVPVVGIAKGAQRKNNRFVFDRRDVALDRIVRLYSHVFIKVRDEAHRFAVAYQRKKRAMRD